MYPEFAPVNIFSIKRSSVTAAVAWEFISIIEVAVLPIKATSVSFVVDII
jgi:hypothetical protein